MNDKFVKDSLLPDEQIIATAKFHPVKVWALPILLMVFFFLFGIIHPIINYDSFLNKSGTIIKCDIGSNKYPGGDWSSWVWKKSPNGDLLLCDKTLYRVTNEYGYGGYISKEMNTISLGNISSSDFVSLLRDNGAKDADIVWGSCDSVINLTKLLLFWAVGFIFALGLYGMCKWANSKDEFVITNKRVVAKVGVIRRIAFELQSEQVESIEIHQGIIGRILNFGTLMPTGIGASKVRIGFVVNPFEFRQHFYDLKKPQNN
jgi:hypothetical protein